MAFQFRPRGVCSTKITFELDGDDRIHDVRFSGGCNGNAQGIARLVEGMTAEDAIQRLDGIRCGFKSTSCPDQLAQALREALTSEADKTE